MTPTPTPRMKLLAFCTDEIYLTALINVLSSRLVFSAAVGGCTVWHNRLLMWKQIYLRGVMKFAIKLKQGTERHNASETV